jgi:hypothetical protein
MAGKKFDAATEQKRRKLWRALNHYISRYGGFLISPPHAKQLLVERPQGSGPADRLVELGYQPAAM